MNIQNSPKHVTIRWTKPVAVFALIFGLLTLVSGGSVLFGPAAAQVWAGNYLQFVVWFNFLAGGFYIIAAVGLWLGKVWTARLAGLIALATAIVALGFAFVVLSGNDFEMRTVGALAFRFLFWVAITLIARQRTGQT